MSNEAKMKTDADRQFKKKLLKVKFQNLNSPEDFSALTATVGTIFKPKLGGT